VAAIVATGARPVFCDVSAETHTLDAEEIERHIGPNVKAVLVVHLYGQAASMDAILERARKHGLKVLEDCAQAHGARCSGRIVGTLGDAAAFSFYPTKNLGALGDAGAVVSADPGVIERARLLRMYGWRERYISETHSTVSRMDELQAAVLTAKLRCLDAWTTRRKQIAERYRANLDGIVELPPADGVFHLFVVRTPHRDRMKAHLTQKGVGTDIHYPLPAHLQTPYLQYGDGPGSLPETERLAREVLSLPIYPELSDDSVDYVCQVLRTYGA
jgi:dTDP-3-amino-3,4,6-trideoxy-alpha-D-glucose transaminase